MPIYTTYTITKIREFTNLYYPGLSTIDYAKIANEMIHHPGVCPHLKRWLEKEITNSKTKEHTIIGVRN